MQVKHNKTSITQTPGLTFLTYPKPKLFFCDSSYFIQNSSKHTLYQTQIMYVLYL